MTTLQRAASAFVALPAATRGICWMILSAAAYVLTYAVARFLAESDFNAFQIVFFRALVGVVLMLPWLMRAGLGALRTRRYGTYAARIGLNYVGMVLLMYGVANLALQDVTALMFTVPMFTVLCVALILGEKVGLARWLALLAGFAGALVILRPGLVPLNLASLAVLGTCASYALVNTATKSLTRTEDPNAVVFILFACMATIGLGPALWDWTMPALADLPWIVAMGMLSSLAVVGTTRALAATDASVVMPFNFLKLPFSVVVGFAIWSEFPDLWTIVGALIIFAAGWDITRRENAARRKAAA